MFLRVQEYCRVHDWTFTHFIVEAVRSRIGLVGVTLSEDEIYGGISCKDNDKEGGG